MLSSFLLNIALIHLSLILPFFPVRRSYRATDSGVCTHEPINPNVAHTEMGVAYRYQPGRAAEASRKSNSPVARMGRVGVGLFPRWEGLLAETLPGQPPVEEMARVQKASRGPGARMQKRQIMPRWLPAIWELAAEVSPADAFQLVDCSVSTCSCPGKRAHASHTAPLPCILIWDFRYMFRTRTRLGK